MKKMKYEGHLPEVELLLTGKRFKRGVEVVVSEEEYNALKPYKEFKLIKQAKKEGAK